MLKDAPGEQVSDAGQSVASMPSRGTLKGRPQFIDGCFGPYQALGSKWDEVGHRRVAASRRQFGGDETRFEASR